MSLRLLPSWLSAFDLGAFKCRVFGALLAKEHAWRFGRDKRRCEAGKARIKETAKTQDRDLHYALMANGGSCMRSTQLSQRW